MYSSKKLPPDFEIYDSESKELLAHILRSIEPTKADLKVSATASWYAESNRKGQLYLLKEGMLTYRRDGKILFSFNEGDLIGVENFFCVSNAELESEFAVIVDEYTAEGFFDSLHSAPELLNLWNAYLAKQFAMFSIMLANSVSPEESYVPDVQFFMPGESIFEQGDSGLELYALIEGTAEIVKDGIVCGSIGPEQFCGLLSGLSGMPRPCGVVAKEECIAVRIDRAAFKLIVASRVHAVQAMLEKLGRDMLGSGAKLPSDLS